MVDVFKLDGLREELAEVVGTVGQDGLPGPRDLDVAVDAILSSVQGALEACKDREALVAIKEALEPKEYGPGQLLKAVVQVLPEPTTEDR